MRRTLNVHTASKILGHATVKQTEEYFAELSTDEIDRAFKDME